MRERRRARWAPVEPDNPFAEMELEIDPYGQEIFIETRDTIGRPAVWYRYDSNGVLKKRIRDCIGIKVEKANPILFGKWALVGKEALRELRREAAAYLRKSNAAVR